MKVTYVGGGNMAAALIGGGLKADQFKAHEFKADEIAVLEVDAARRDQLKRDYGVSTHSETRAALTDAELVVLAVKPQQMREACSALQPFIGNATVLSIAAGIRMQELAQWLGTQRLVRAMPNTPALIGQGISGVCALPVVTENARRQVETLLSAVGHVLWFEHESQLDAVTALSGSGPAYVFYFIEALVQAGEQLGLETAQARELAVQTVAGAGALAAQSTEAISTLRERVTSKGGTTAAGLNSMAQDQVDEALVRAVHAAHRRAVELGESFSAT